MIVDLVRTTTSDAIRLDGVLHQPVNPGGRELPVDSVICLHGVASSFYGSTLMERVTPSLLELGIPVLWCNTRGHDNVHTTYPNGQARRQGAAYEIVDECRFDIDAWIQFMVERDFARVALFGHSLGAIKAVYSQAYHPHSAVRRIIASSPPRLSFSAFNNSESSAVYFQTLAAAEQHVADGRPENLMEVPFPFPLLITAGGYVDKYGRQERYNILKFADQLRCPTLFTYGQLELERGGIAFAGLPAALAGLPDRGQRFDIQTIAGADHLYTAKQHELAAAIVGWLSA